jgi:hypothetical protein
MAKLTDARETTYLASSNSMVDCLNISNRRKAKKDNIHND